MLFRFVTVKFYVDIIQYLEILKVYKIKFNIFRNVFENRHIFATISVYTSICKGRKCLYKHSLFIINIFITKLLENGTPFGVPFSFLL